jgi:membrane protease YdiL (CAAX protease family)
MLENDLNSHAARHPVINLISILLVVGLGFVIVGPFIGFFLSLPFYPGNMQEMVEALQDPASHPELKIPLYIMQGFATLIGLILAPALWMTRTQTSVTDFFKDHKFEWIPVIITATAVIIFMAVNSVFIEWNSNFIFPEFAKGFETWAREREDAATELTTFLTKFESPAELAIAILVIAVLPAIGEEIVFRGLIQNELYRGTKNIHVSIWVAAILFSAIHMQFFGFVPRLLLGALFGYLYYWSGNLTLAMLAHFVNNGISVVAMYFYQQGAFDYDLESTESLPANVVIISIFMTGGLLYYFYKYFEHRKPSIPQS